MRTIEVTVYKFDELSEKAKNKALSAHCENIDYPWSSENEQTLNSFADIMPVKVKNWSYGGRGEGVYFDFTDTNLEELKGNRLRTYIINNYHDLLFERKPYGKYTKNEITGKWSYKRRSAILYTESLSPLTGYCVDEGILSPLRKFVTNPGELKHFKSTTFKDLMEDCFSEWVKECSDDYEYYFSEESFKDLCEANEYEFDEHGNLI